MALVLNGLTSSPSRSVFATHNDSVFTTYYVALRFRDRLYGGIPKNPAIVRGWLLNKTGVTDKSEDLRQFMLRTLAEQGVPVSPELSFEQLEELADEMAAVRNTNGFKRDASGLYLESRAVKAMVKEVVSILYPYQGKDGKWGPTRKAARALTAERVFVDPDHIALGVQEPDGTELFIGHTNGPSGPKSNLTYYEYVHEREIRFALRVAEDMVPHDAWPRLWVLAQENGLGALRSQGMGRFDVTAWDRA